MPASVLDERADEDQRLGDVGERRPGDREGEDCRRRARRGAVAAHRLRAAGHLDVDERVGEVVRLEQLVTDRADPLRRESLDARIAQAQPKPLDVFIHPDPGPVEVAQALVDPVSEEKATVEARDRCLVVGDDRVVEEDVHRAL